MSTHGALTESSRTNSLITPIGKGREGKGRGMEGNAAAIPLLVESDESPFKLKSPTREGIEIDG